MLADATNRAHFQQVFCTDVFLGIHMTLFRLLSLAILISPMVDAMSDELQPNFQMSSIGEVRTAPDDGISGRYQLSSEQAGDSSEMTLECADENACTLSTTLHSQGHLSVDVRRLHMSLAGPGFGNGQASASIRSRLERSDAAQRTQRCQDDIVVTNAQFQSQNISMLGCQLPRTRFFAGLQNPKFGGQLRGCLSVWNVVDQFLWRGVLSVCH
ncbi:MAG: hypothetical protein GWN66_16580 [Pseudomonas stutzeri]|nr:hypothetical protein [Stutzerimonas stutzeri]